MSKKLLEAYYKAVENGNLERAMEEAKEIFIKNTLVSGYYGRHHKITLHEDSTISISEPLEKNEELYSTYQGKSVTLATLKGVYENSFEFSDEYIMELTPEEKNMLFEKVADYLELDLEGEYKHIRSIKELYDEFPYATEDKYAEIFKKKYHEMLLNHVEACWSIREFEGVLDKIEYTIELIAEQIELEEKYM